MDFGKAIEALKEGELVARKGWNGKGMFIFMQGGYVTGAFIFMQGGYVTGADNLPDNVEDWFKTHVVSAGPCPNVEFVPYLCMKAADDTIVRGWLASQTDMLSDDWEIVTPPTEG